jgi:hypothetical protein
MGAEHRPQVNRRLLKVRLTMTRDLNTVIGTPELCGWQPAPGVTWVQTRSPQFARKLSQRNDSRLIVRGVAGGYLRTFEFLRNLAWARRLISRYIADETLTNARKNSPACPAVAPELAWHVTARGHP